MSPVIIFKARQMTHTAFNSVEHVVALTIAVNEFQDRVKPILEFVSGMLIVIFVVLFALHAIEVTLRYMRN